MKNLYGIEIHYSRTIKRTVSNGCITYSGIKYSSDELEKLNGQVLKITRFAENPGEFDIGKMLVDPVGEFKDHFWIKPVSTKRSRHDQVQCES